MEVTERDLQNLYSWIDDIPLSRPKRNFTRDFSDGVLMAEVLHHYFPKFVQMHNYSSANGLRQKRYNWDTLNRKVFRRLGVEVTKEELEDIANCTPRAIERLLKLTREKILEYQAGHNENIDRVKTPDCTYQTPPPPPLYEHGEDANNTLAVNVFANATTTEENLRSKRISQIPRAPSQLSLTPPPQLSITPPPAIEASRRPKSSFDICSSLEKDVMIKELQETNELLLAKISKLEQLLRLKDKKIESLSSKLHIPNNNNYSGSVTP